MPDFFSRLLQEPLERRRLLSLAARFGLSALLLPHLAERLLAEELRPSKRMRRRPLGKTGYQVSEIGMGTALLTNPEVVSFALDSGINYIDTAPDYLFGASERAIGKVLKYRRREAVVATKWHPWSFTKKDQMLKSLETSLRRLQTDHVDLIQVHQVGKVSGPNGYDEKEGIGRIENPELWEAFKIAKRQGKALHIGVTGHDGDLMEIMHHALGMERFSTLLCRYNFLDYPEQNTLFSRARNLGVGVAVMKTLAGARASEISSLRTPKATFAQAALRWTLQNPHLSTAVITMQAVAQVQEYVLASWAPFRGEERRMLERYAALHSKDPGSPSAYFSS